MSCDSGPVVPPEQARQADGSWLIKGYRVRRLRKGRGWRVWPPIGRAFIYKVVFGTLREAREWIAGQAD